MLGSSAVDSFNRLVDGDTGIDRPMLWEGLRERTPVFFSERLDAWVLTRYDHVRAVLSNEAGFANLTEGPGAPAFGRSFTHWRGREHNKKVGIVARHIRSARAVADTLDPLVVEIVRRQADRLPFGEPLDLRASYTSEIPLLVIAELMGIPEAGRLTGWYHDIVQGGLSSIGRPELKVAAEQARRHLTDYVMPIIDERRRDPGHDLISHLVTAEYDGAPLPDEEIVSVVIFLLPSGIETTERAMASGFAHLAGNPEAWDRLRERRHDPDAVMAFAVEVLRMFAPVQATNRKSLAAAEIGGVPISAGDKLFCSLAAANRDPRRFDDAEVFDPGRWITKPEIQFTSAGTVLPFGAGPHHCTGSRLAGVELKHAFHAILTRATGLEPSGDIPPGEGLVLYSPPAVPVVLTA
jgi:cytochrome P450